MNHFDFIEDQTVRVRVETKMCGSDSPLVLYADQLRSQLDESSFPIEDGLIWIFYYHNQGKGIHRISVRDGSNTTYIAHPSLLKAESGKSWKSLSLFLASHIYRADVIHISILERWLARYGTTDYIRYGKDHPERNLHKPRPVINISRTDIKKLGAETREGLRELGFSEEEVKQWLPPGAQQIHPHFIETAMDENPLDFPLFLLLPNAIKQRFLSRLNGNIRRTMSTHKEPPAYK